MKLIYCKNVDWNGDKLRIIFPKGNYKINGLSIWSRKSKQIKLIEYSSSEFNQSEMIEIDVTQFRNLHLDKWDFYVKNKRSKKWIRIALDLNSTVSSKNKYFEPIVDINPSRSLVFFLSNKNTLSLHCSTLDILEDMTFNIVTYKRLIESIDMQEDRLIFHVDSTDYLKQTELVLKNELDETYKVSFEILGDNIILLKDNLKSFRGCLTFYFQYKKGRILEQTKLFSVDNLNTANKNPLSIPKQNQIQLYEDTILAIDIKDHNRPLDCIEGELIVEDFYLNDRDMMFSLSSAFDSTAHKWNFYLKQSNSDEKLYLISEYKYDKDKIIYSINMKQLKILASKKTIWNLYAEKNHINYLEVNRLVELNSGKDKYKGYTSLQNDICAVPSVSKSMHLRVLFMSIDQYYKFTSPANVSIKSLTMKNGIIKLKLLISLNKEEIYEVCGLRLIQRKDPNRSFNIPMKKSIKSKQEKVEISSYIDLTSLPFEPFYWDLYAFISLNDNEIRKIRIYCDNYFVIKKLRHFMSRYSLINNQSYLTYPYLTVNGGLSITYRKKGEYESRKNKISEYFAYSYYHLIFKFFNREPIWLVHEKYSETAQDNSFYFFSYSYKQHHNKKVYYVIKKGTKDENNLNEYKDRVLYFMSFRHLVYLLASKVIISSEAKGHGYAWRVNRGVIKDYLISKKFVFLQHGVLGLKKVDNTFDYNTQNSAELFVTSSEYEKRIVKSYFGYKDNQVIVTGLPRWDVLKDQTGSLDQEKKEILLMPTWRNWLDEVEEKDFVESDYYKAYNSLLHSNSLHKFLDDESIIMNFYVHPKFMPYVSSFTKNSENIRIIQFGEEKVNDLLMRSSLLITDYSSVSWEMYYQKKPVIFFHFDLEKYQEYQGSYMDFKKELFGEVAFNSEDLIEQMIWSARMNFKERSEYAVKRNEYFKYIDSKNSERIFNEIVLKEKEINKKRSIIDVIKEMDTAKVLWRKYRNVQAFQRFGKKLLTFIK